MRKSLAPGIAVAAAVLLAGGVHAADITAPTKVPYAEPESVREAIRKECDLEKKMAQMLAAHDVTLKDGDLSAAPGKVFLSKITGVWAGGGPWGAASIQVEGELRDGGKVIGTVTAKRNTSRGGGACNKLHVSANAIAKDLAGWFNAPSMDAKLGDAK